VAAAGPEKAKQTVRKFPQDIGPKQSSCDVESRASVAPKAPDFDLGG
jgi:hypothetical protein